MSRRRNNVRLRGKKNSNSNRQNKPVELTRSGSWQSSGRNQWKCAIKNVWTDYSTSNSWKCKSRIVSENLWTTKLTRQGRRNSYRWSSSETCFRKKSRLLDWREKSLRDNTNYKCKRSLKKWGKNLRVSLKPKGNKRKWRSLGMNEWKISGKVRNKDLWPRLRDSRQLWTRSTRI